MTKVKIVAEIGCNHCGDLVTAKDMILAARDCGADYVKFQKRDLSSMSKPQRGKLYDGPHSFGYTYGEHREALEFSKDDFATLFETANLAGIGCFATPFDTDSFDFLLELGVKVMKLGSTQIHDATIISHCQENLPSDVELIVSTGMMDMYHVWDLNTKLHPNVLMQTTSCYPCKEEDVHLSVLRELQVLSEEVGLSGHYTSGNGAIEAAAVAIGATWIERHFTPDRSMKGTDQAASLEPEGLRNVVKAVRTVERALGSHEKKKLECEQETWRKISGQVR